MLMNNKNTNFWIPCNVKMPNGVEIEIHCLITCQEWNIFDGKWSEKEVRILSYSTHRNEWNTKSDIKVEA